MFTNRRKLYSQNFLHNRQLVQKLVRASSIGPDDHVVEIGAGKGVITSELLEVAGHVTSIEIDKGLCRELGLKFGQSPKLRLVNTDFLSFPLPQTTYKMFANIPFRFTADIVRRLLLSNNPPLESHLVMQKEASEKYITKTKGNNMAAILYYPWWEISILHHFDRTDFEPVPNVDSVLIRFKRRANPLLTLSELGQFRDFVVSNFNKNKSAKNILAIQWLVAYRNLLNSGDHQKLKSIKGAFKKLTLEQNQLEKIHRTRNDANWRRFG